MSVEQLDARLRAGDVTLLDVRSAAEFAAGCVFRIGFASLLAAAHARRCRRVPGALSVPLEELSARAKAGELGAAPSARLAVVCASGGRSAQAAVRLKRVLGFADVTNVRGGLAAWTAAGLPVQT